MIIAVNTRLLLPGKLDGIGWFTYHTLRHLTESNPSVKWYFYFDRPWSSEFVFSENVTPLALFPQARHPFLYYWWFEHSVRNALNRHRPHLFLSPDGYLSLSSGTKQLSVMHDLNFEHYPGDLPFLTRHYYRYYFRKFAQKATRIATVSEFSKKDIVKCYNIQPDKIDVVYNGVNSLFEPLSAENISMVRSKYTGGAPYFLFVGMLHQRKNIANLLRAYEHFRHHNASAVKMLIAGHKKWWTTEMESVYSHMKFKEDVIFTGRLPVDELVRVTASALAITYVSYFEGFGVPIIEAMRCGVPVITSNITSMPEVSGGAAILVDPFSVESIASAMQQVSADSNVQHSLSRMGILQSQKFSWESTSLKLWDCILKAAGL